MIAFLHLLGWIALGTIGIVVGHLARGAGYRGAQMYVWIVLVGVLCGISGGLLAIT